LIPAKNSETNARRFGFQTQKVRPLSHAKKNSDDNIEATVCSHVTKIEENDSAGRSDEEDEKDVKVEEV